jgi:hypothetical protein
MSCNAMMPPSRTSGPYMARSLRTPAKVWSPSMKSRSMKGSDEVAAAHPPAWRSRSTVAGSWESPAMTSAPWLSSSRPLA